MPSAMDFPVHLLRETGKIELLYKLYPNPPCAVKPLTIRPQRYTNIVFRASAKRAFSRPIDRRDVAVRADTMYVIRVIARELQIDIGKIVAA